MAAPPGCPLRRVDQIERVRGGAFVKLSCGHSNWEAGFDDDDHENIARFNAMRPCLQGPCYKYQRPMGRDC